MLSIGRNLYPSTEKMPRKAKPVVNVGAGEWKVDIPRPPKRATHARMTCIDLRSPKSTPKVATLPIQDFACFKGVSGDFHYLRLDNKKKIVEEWDELWHWSGFEVENLPQAES